jgi:D-alanyl-D-alanine carboxypeptidase
MWCGAAPFHGGCHLLAPIGPCMGIVTTVGVQPNRFASQLGGLAVAVALISGGCAIPAASIVPSLSEPSAVSSSTPVSPSAAASALPLGPLPTTKLNSVVGASLQAVLDGLVEAGEQDAIAAVITENGTWAGAAGVADSNGRAAAVDDEFAIASVTKMFTATLIIRLVEQGKMDLDSPLAAYLGDMAVDTNQATVRQALEMKAGLPETSPGILYEADPSRVWTAGEIVATFLPPDAAPGTRYLYSNPTYKLLAFAAEHVTGMSYASALRAEVLDPFGFNRILSQGPEVVTPQPWALPLSTHAGEPDPATFGQGGALPSLASATFTVGTSSMASDAPSLAAWGWLLFAGQIVSSTSLSEMVPIGHDEYGLGLERQAEFEPVLAYGHAGHKPGYGAMLAFFPERRIVIVVLDNNPDAALDLIARSLLLAASAS